MVPPSGTVALLFTDIEGSTALAHRAGERWGDVLAAHHEVVGGAIAAHGGYVDGTEGDAFFAVFPDARDAVRAAVEAQRGLRRRAWPPGTGAPRVRMGVHVGAVARRPTHYVGLEVHRAARVAAAAHGGQLLLTGTAVALAGDVVPVEDLGRHRLKDFPAPEALFHAVIDGEGAAAFPPPRTLAVRPTNLPVDDRLFVGRREEVDAIVGWLAAGAERLVTLTGLGGSGKTRLALAAATALLDAHPGGVWWIPLATVTEPGAVPGALAAAIGAEDDGSRPIVDVLAARIGTHPTLAVFDNLEHLPDAVLALADLLAAAPGLRILATSQRPLRLVAERVLPVPPLVPDASRELFVRAAERLLGGMRFSDADLELVDDLCARLDHLPLAIELAAGRLAVLTLRQLADRLAGSVDLLRGAERDRPERHRSLRATIEWTLSLLEEDPRRLFTRLGAFAGAVELEDLEAVCGQDGLDVLAGTAALLDVGILRRGEDGSGTARMRLPEALRQVAAAELDASPEGPRLREAHAHHVADAIWPAAAAMMSTMTAYRRAEALDAEAVLALAWAWDHDVALACRLAGARAVRLSDLGRMRESQDLGRRVLARPDAGAGARAAALCALGHDECALSRWATGRPLLEEACGLLEAGDDLRLYAGFLLVYAQAQEAHAWREVSDRWVAEAREHGSGHALAAILTQRAQAALVNDEPDTAAPDLEEAARFAAASDAKVSWHLDTIRADLDLQTGHPERAATGFLRSMTAAAEAGNARQVFLDLHGLAAALSNAGRHLDALEAYGLALAQGEDIGRGVGQLDDADPIYGAAIRRARAELDAGTAHAATARGRSVPAGRRVEEARALVGAGRPRVGVDHG